VKVIWFGAVLVVLVVVVTVWQLASIRSREKSNHALAEWVHGQPESFSTRTFVREHFPWRWTNWSNSYAGGPVLSVRGSGIQLLAGQGMVLESRNLYFDAAGSKMWRDSVGWGGTPIARKACIRLLSGEGRMRIDVALTPEVGIEATWLALDEAGVAAAT